MSLAPVTEAGLREMFSRAFRTKPTPAAAMQLPSAAVGAAVVESEAFWNADYAIQSIAHSAFDEVVERRERLHFRRKEQLSGSDPDERSIRDAALKISRVLWEMKEDERTAVVDLYAAGRLADRAIWALLVIATRRSAYTPEVKDGAVAYVMRNLLFPHKRPHTRAYAGHSLLYQTICRINFTFGPEVFAAIVSCKDHLFRKWELNDTVAISAFEKRYNIKPKNLRNYVC
jgi:hypothetical protein